MIVSSDIERLQTLEDKERQLLLELMWALARETEVSAKKAEDEVLKETQRLQNIERKVRNNTMSSTYSINITLIEFIYYTIKILTRYLT